MPKKMEATKNEIIDDIKAINKMFQQEHPGAVMTRTYYTAHSKLKHKYADYGTWRDIFTQAVGIVEDDSIDKIGNKIILIEDENKKLKSLTKATKKSLAFEAVLLEEWKALISSGKSLTPTKIKYIKKREGLHGVLILSDWHAGLKIDPASVNYLNEYDSNILTARADDVFAQLLAHVINFKISQLTLVLNGDMLHGQLRDEDDRACEMNVMQSTLFVQKYLTGKITEMAQHVPVHVVVLVGNHARAPKSKPYYADKVSYNFEYILGKQLQHIFEVSQGKKQAVTVTVPETPFVVIQPNNHKILLTHGDILAGSSSSFCSIPLYGLSSSAAKLYGLLTQVGVNESVAFDSLVIGHYHISAKFPMFTGHNMYLSGCLCGTDAFSMSKMKSAASVSQLLLMIDTAGNVFLDIPLKVR